MEKVNFVQAIVNYIGNIPGRIWWNPDSPWWVPYRESFHFFGGTLVALLGFWNSIAQDLFGLTMLGIVIYGEIGDVRSGSPLWKSFLDVAFWLGGFVLTTWATH